MYMGFPGGASGKEPACQLRRHRKHGFSPWVGKVPWRRTWQPTPVFLPGESQGQRSLAGCSPRGHTEPDMTEHTHTPDACIHMMEDHSAIKKNEMRPFATAWMSSQTIIVRDASKTEKDKHRTVSFICAL